MRASCRPLIRKLTRGACRLLSDSHVTTPPGRKGGSTESNSQNENKVEASRENLRAGKPPFENRLGLDPYKFWYFDAIRQKVYAAGVLNESEK